MFEELLAALAGELSAKAIPYMVIGGQAVLLYGEPRLTRDIDITLGVADDRLADILQVAASLSLKLLIGNAVEFVRRTMVLPVEDEKTGIRVDFIFSLTDYERQAIERARKVEIGGGTVDFASQEDLIIHKIFAGRARDIEDAKSVARKNREPDVDYMRKCLTELQFSVVDCDMLALLEEILSA